MNRGAVYTAAARGAYTSKPRPVVIIQDDRFDATESVTVCPLTSNQLDAPVSRVAIEPSDDNGLGRTSWLMVDKVITMPRATLTERLGRLSPEDQVRLNRSLVVFLGLAD